MAYSDFTTVNKATKAFNLEIIEQGLLFLQEAPPIQPSHLLSEILTDNLPLAIATGTEKARSELLISPILVELRRNFQRKISLFSGESFDVDPNLGLNEVCDFLIGGSPVQSEIKEPVLVVVEAKKGDLKTGLGQCIAEMAAAQMFNESSNINRIYGAVTISTLWRFLSLQKNEVFIDLVEYPLPPVDKILGILTIILNSFKLVDQATISNS